MTVYGALRIGRVTITESPEVEEQAADDGRTVTLAGQEASEKLTQAAARVRAEQLLAYRGVVVPCAWELQSHRDGWYRVTDVRAAEFTWHDHTDIRWGVSLERIGRDAEIEIESRLTGSSRAHIAAATAELWHAAPVGAGTYYVGSSTPGYVDRSSADGTVRVYRSIPANTHPRWAVPASSALAGASSVTVNGSTMAGLTCDDTPTSWLLSNGLIRVAPLTAGTITITAYTGSAWGTGKTWKIWRNGAALTAAAHVTILRNDPCTVVIRLTWDHAPGRSTLDLTLKRGARHVEMLLQSHAVTSWQVDDTIAGNGNATALASAGYVESVNADANGNKWLVGTPVAVSNTALCGIYSTVAVFPAFVGVVKGGASAVSGDTAAHVNAQYLGTPIEAERPVRR